MRDEYIGDIGDFGKYILLNKLAGLCDDNTRIGINWYYNRQPAGAFRYLYDRAFENVAPLLHGKLKAIAEDTTVSLERVETDSILREGFVHYRKEIPYKDKAPCKRQSERERWFKDSIKCLADAKIVFLDPDNGIPYPKANDDDIEHPRIDKGTLDAIRYAYADEIKDYYDNGKSVIVYNHRDRKPDDEYQRKFVLLKEYIQPPGKMPILRFVKFQIRDYLIIPQKPHDEIFKQLVAMLTTKPFDFLFDYLEIT